jgi:hypothetical protein
MLKCDNCEDSVFDVPLFRTVPVPQVNYKWMCMGCLEIIHPDMAANQKISESKVEKDLKKICYPKNK